MGKYDCAVCGRNVRSIPPNERRWAAGHWFCSHSCWLDYESRASRKGVTSKPKRRHKWRRRAGWTVGIIVALFIGLLITAAFVPAPSTNPTASKASAATGGAIHVGTYQVVINVKTPVPEVQSAVYQIRTFDQQSGTFTGRGKTGAYPFYSLTGKVSGSSIKLHVVGLGSGAVAEEKGAILANGGARGTFTESYGYSGTWTMTPPSAAARGTRLRPIPFGSSALVVGGQWRMKINSVTRNANKDFKQQPSPGARFVVVSATAKYVGGGSTQTYTLGVQMHLIGKHGASYQANEGCYPPRRIDREASVFSGRSITGQACFEIATNDVSTLRLYVGDSTFGNAPEADSVWFALT
jgi:hypothetical protein